MNKKIVLGILLGIALIIVSVYNINFHETIAHIKAIDPKPAGLSLFFIVFMQVLRSYRWGVLLEPLEKVKHLSVFAVTNVGFLAICTYSGTPGGAGQALSDLTNKSHPHVLGPRHDRRRARPR